MTKEKTSARVRESLTASQKAALDVLLAGKKARAHGRSVEVPRIVADPANKDEPFPLTDIQQAQWFGRSGLFDISVAGHGYVEFDCKGMDLDRLEEAFQIIIDRNPQMRIVVRSDMTQQVLNDLPPYKFRRYDFRGEPRAVVERTLAETRERMSHEILSATTWPIFEVCASLWGEDELRIHFNFDLLVGDAWCFRTIVDEWARLYDDPGDARPVPAELTYRDYVQGFAEIERSVLFEQSLKYWRERLSDLPSPPQLPMIRQPGELERIRAKHYSVRLTGTEWDRLRHRIRTRNLTPSAFFAAAFSDVLALWNAAPAHTLNVTVFNRLPVHEDIDDILVGEFNSFLLLGIDSSRVESFVARASRLQAELWSHLENRWVTGVRLMRELASERGVAPGESLMPVVFTSTIAHHEGESVVPTRSPGRWIYEVSQTPQVWMEHHLWEEDDSLLLHVDVVDGLFPEGLIEDLVATYEALIRDLMDDTASWERTDVSRLLPTRYADLWQAYNRTETERPEGLLHDGFVRTAGSQGDRTAIVSTTGNCTYAELDRCSNRLAHALQEAGARPGELVAIIAPKGWQQIAGVLGVAKSGAAYLPIDADDPAARIAQILEDARVSVAVTSYATRDTLDLPGATRVIAVDDAVLERYPDTPPENAATPDDTAYVIYTSGSTGKPKGVVIRHSAALNTCADINARFDVGRDDAILAISALNFDLSVYDIFGGLSAGATLVMPSTQRPHPDEWADLVEEHGISVWNSVPALAELFMTHVEEAGRIVPETLRLVMLSGDWIPLALPPMLQTIRPDMRVISLGGATEASIWSIYYPIDGISPDWNSIPYGRPLANQTMHVLDHNLRDCPPWVTGEICIGGIGLADGYFGDSARTAASFVVHPESGQRLYRTGDLGRFNPKGFIEFLGRRDTQVKLRGYRIELGDIEAAIAETGLTSQAVCLVAGKHNVDRQLIAFVTSRSVSTEETIAAALTAALRDRLPHYMLPAVIRVLKEIPLTANGKVDRSRLCHLAEDLNHAGKHVEPRNDTEARIATMWKSLLGVEQVGVHDDFFSLGGNSMTASRLLIQIQDAFDIELPFAKLFEATSVAALSELVTAAVLAEVEALEHL